MMFKRLLWISVFAAAFAYVEAAVVVYLRSLYYPEGFSFPLTTIPSHHLWVELAREFSTIVMLAAAGILAGTTRWSRFAFFALAFGVWDIFYYFWLKVILDWPATLFDWDILFLIPLPWIGPVIAPLLISVALVVAGTLTLRYEASGMTLHPPRWAWILSLAGSAILLLSFMGDVEAGLREGIPKPYRYELLGVGLLCYAAAMVLVFRPSRKSEP
jgi:hypothetical protein